MSSLKEATTGHDITARERWLRWRVYAGDLALVAGLAGGLYLVFGVAGFSAWSALGFLAGAALAGRWYAGRGERVRHAQRARQDILARDARGEERPPILILRSFLSPVTMPAAETVRVLGRERPINEPDSPAAPRSHVLSLASELRKSGPVVAIGAARSGIAGSPRVDVLFLEPDDADWVTVFETVSLGCHAVILLPGETGGVMHEVASLRSRNLLRKLILVMPPLRRQPVTLPWLRVHTQDVIGGWEAACDGLRTLGVALPGYDPQGLVFTVNDDGTVRDRQPLGGSFVRLGRAVRALLPRDRELTARPLRDIMRDLEPFDLPGFPRGGQPFP